VIEDTHTVDLMPLGIVFGLHGILLIEAETQVKRKYKKRN
jgi:hypothetical protein